MKALILIADVVGRAINSLKRRLDAYDRRQIARRHNSVHTYSGPERVGGTWMCPTCNTVHYCTGTAPITGRQFPACCEFKAGSRLEKSHATKW